METKVTYGRVFRGAEWVGFCGYIDEQGRKVDIFSPPQKPLEVYVDGKRVKTQAEHVIIWTQVAGWLGEKKH